MVVLRSAALVIGLTTIATVESAGTVSDSVLWKLNNSSSRSDSHARSAYEPVLYSFCDVDLVGGDIGNARYPTPGACVTNCKTENGCDAATWTNYKGGTCWFKQLKTSWTSATPVVGATSFLYIDPQVFNGPNPRADVDMPGNDIGNKPASSLYKCVEICSNNLECFAYTWTKYNGGRVG